MTSIDTSQRLIGLLRARISTLRRPEAGRPPGRATEHADARASSMAQRIRSIAADDPDRCRKAVRVYLEAELAHEFGSRVLSDPVFPQMLDAVQEQMAQDPATSRAVHALGDLLISGGAR